MNKKNQRIQVFARCRPINDKEQKQGAHSVVDVFPKEKRINIRDRNKDFSFDKVFPPDSKQIDVYKSVAEPLIQEVLKGYNCTVFAYGQTGTGKTYTMEGERNNVYCSWEDDPGAGIVPRSLHQLFEELNKGDNVEYSVRVSFIELYCEEVFDLLSSNDELTKLMIFEDTTKKGSVFVKGQEEIIVNSKDEVYAILQKGSDRRKTAATLLNEKSSRSHTIFSITVHSKENTVEGEELLKTGKLNLVDLAGSECVGRSGCVDKRFRESGNINQSLLTLGRVITALIEKQPHIPYRESKLTRLLQDSLGGHTKTSIIATISPAQCALEETLSTLDYASKAKSITIKPVANERMTKKAYMRELTEKIERLQRDLDAARTNSGFFVATENYTQMISDIDNLTKKNKDFEEKIENLTEEKAALVQSLTLTQENLSKKKQENKEMAAKIEHISKVLNETKQALDKMREEKEEKEYLLSIHCEKEKKLSNQALTLLDVTTQSTRDVTKLQSAVNRKRKVEETNENQYNNFREMCQKHYAKLSDMTRDINMELERNFQNMKSNSVEMLSFLNDSKQKSIDNLYGIVFNHSSEVEQFSSCLNNEITAEKLWSESFLENLNAKKESLSSEHFTFLSKTLPLLNKELNKRHTELSNWVLSKNNDICQKTSRLYSEIKTQSAKIINVFRTNISEFLSFCEQFESEIVVYRKYKCSRLSIENELEEDIREFCDKTMKKLNSLRNASKPCDNAVDRMEEFEAELKNSQTFEENIKDLDMETTVTLAAVDDIANTFNDQEIATKFNSSVSSHNTLSSEITRFLENKQEIKELCFSDIKREVLSQSEIHQEKAEKHKVNLKEIQESLSSKINSEVSSLELINSNLQSKLSHTVTIIDSSKEQLNQATNQMREEILLRDLEVNKFIHEDLQRDVPTGTTPQRKNYAYPKNLCVYSPDDKYLQKFRMLREKAKIAVNLPLDSSSDDGEEFKSPLVPDFEFTITNGSNSESTANDTSFNSEEDYLTSCETESNASETSNMSCDSLKNKENCKNYLKPSHLPRLNKGKLTDSNKMSSMKRKPLSSKNPQPSV